MKLLHIRMLTLIEWLEMNKISLLEMQLMVVFKMMDMVIRHYGFESNITIVFCVFAEDSTVSDEEVRKAFDAFMV